MNYNHHNSRRGSVYVLVLVLAMMLTVVGLSLVAVSRVNTRVMGQGGDWYEARGLAFSGVEHAMGQISADANWRTTFSAQTVQKTLGRGTFSWRVADEADGNLLNDTTQPFTVFSTGVLPDATYTLRVHMTMPTGGPLTSGVSTPGAVSLNGATVDSYNSGLGPYGGANVGSQATVATNATAAAAVSLAASSAVKGQVNVGVGGDPATVLFKDGTSTLTGGATALATPISMPTLVEPSVGPSQGWRSYTGNQSDTISADVHLTALEIKSNAVLQISGNVTILVDQNVTIWNKTGLTILPNSSLKLYFKGNLNIAKNAAGSVSGPNLSRMQYLNLGSNPVLLGDNSSAQGVIVSPNAPIQMSGGFQFYGAIVAKSLTMIAGAALHEDKRITGGTDPVSFGPGSSRPIPDSWSQVVN